MGGSPVRARLDRLLLQGRSTRLERAAHVVHGADGLLPVDRSELGRGGALVRQTDRRSACGGSRSTAHRARKPPRAAQSPGTRRMTFKVVVFGPGKMGSVAIWELSRRPEFELAAVRGYSEE